MIIHRTSNQFSFVDLDMKQLDPIKYLSICKVGKRENEAYQIITTINASIMFSRKEKRSVCIWL